MKKNRSARDKVEHPTMVATRSRWGLLLLLGRHLVADRALTKRLGGGAQIFQERSHLTGALHQVPQQTVLVFAIVDEACLALVAVLLALLEPCELASGQANEGLQVPVQHEAGSIALAGRLLLAVVDERHLFLRR